MKTNNKCREALELCIDELCNRCRANAAAQGNPLPCLTGCDVVRKAKAALADTPPRNCDIGTAEEQNLRHSEWCHKHGIDGDGDVNCASPDMHCHLCFAKWAQMPYETVKTNNKGE